MQFAAFFSGGAGDDRPKGAEETKTQQSSTIWTADFRTPRPLSVVSLSMECWSACAAQSKQQLMQAAPGLPAQLVIIVTSEVGQNPSFEAAAKDEVNHYR